MDKRIVMTALLGWAVSAYADNWEVLADTKLGQLKLDKHSVAIEGKYTSAVLVYEFKDLQRLTAPPNSSFKKRLDEVVVDCSQPALGIQTSRFYDEGKLVHTQTKKPDEVKLNPAEPDSMALNVTKAICALKPK